MIPDWKGPASRDEKLLYDNGELIMDGLIRAVGDKIPEFAALLRGFTSDIPGMASDGTSSAAYAVPMPTGNNYGNTVNQEVTIINPVAERGSKSTDKSLQLAGAFGGV